MDGAHLRLWYDETSGSAYALVTDAHGVALLPEPVGTPVRVLVQPDDRVDCRLTLKTYADPVEGYNLAALAGVGAVAVNHCGRIGAKPKPGELVLFVRPLRWYEVLNRPTSP